MTRPSLEISSILSRRELYETYTSEDGNLGDNLRIIPITTLLAKTSEERKNLKIQEDQEVIS